MEMRELTITKREGVGKGPAKRLRRDGRVPAILYGGDPPNSRHSSRRSACPLCANSGHSRNGLKQKERPPRGGLSEIRSGAIKAVSPGTQIGRCRPRG